MNGGGITRFNVPQLPFAIPALSIVLRFLVEPQDFGEHQLHVEFTNPDGLQVLPPDPATVPIARVPGVVAGEESFTQIVLGFGGMPILATGPHILRITWDNEIVREFSIPVELIETPPVVAPNRAERRRQQRA